MASEDGSKHKSSEMCRVKFSDLSIYAQEFVPQQSHAASVALYDPLSNTSKLFDYLFDDPENLTNILDNLEGILSNYMNNGQSLEAIIDNILKKCVERNNVQFIAAHCCVHLCQNPIFKDAFIKRCNVMHKEFLSTSDFCGGVTNFTLLISELSLLLKLPEGCLFEALLNAVVELLNKLLDFSNDLSIQCIQKVLKLSGSTLDQLVTENFSKFFDRMKEKTVTDDNSKESRAILLDLIILRSAGWQVYDATASTSTSQELSDPLSEIDMNGDEHGCIYYGATIFRNNFEHFLVPNEDAEPEIYEDYEKFLAENEEGMDASVQQDYETFLENLEKKVP